MKLLPLLSSALLATAVSARSAIHISKEPTPQDNDELSVPGKNPLTHCENPKDDILALKSVDLDPNPPTAGTTLSITASGTLSQSVTSGAKVHLTVKYGLITIIRQEADLCDTVKNVDLECPIEKGDLKITKEVSLPAQIPPGKYSVQADVVTEDDERITCLKATVEFHRGSVGDVVGGLFKQQGPKQEV